MLDELKAKFRFWYADKFIEHNKHYEFMFDSNNSDAVAIRLIKRYPGVIVEYTNIHMSSDVEMAYDFNIIANPNLCNIESVGFKNFTSDIFRSIINNSVKHAIKDKDENRNTDFVESDSERAIHEEVTALFEERVPQRKPRKKTIRRNKKVHSKVQ